MKVPGFTIRDRMVHRDRGQGRGAIQLTGIVVSPSAQEAGSLHIQMAGSDIKKPSTFRNPDPFLVFMREGEDGKPEPVWETPPARQTASPEWPLVGIPFLQLCGGDRAKKLKILLMNWSDSSAPAEIGSWSASVDGA